MARGCLRHRPAHATDGNHNRMDEATLQKQRIHCFGLEILYLKKVLLATAPTN